MATTSFRWATKVGYGLEFDDWSNIPTSSNCPKVNKLKFQLAHVSATGGWAALSWMSTTVFCEAFRNFLAVHFSRPQI
jgi:hypothetical protein